ncbi:MAG: DNA-deoxyinosine glycosylase [Clostridia bacterium]|nr:DNA-deoxyinosine glycosylase [Clostridia bacterium]
MPTHPIPPVYSTDPQTPPLILILGSFPSVKSRETAFFYGHPQNRFWRVMAAVFDEPVPEIVAEKTALLTAHGIALWDVIASCDIQGSSDSSITNVTPTDLTPILAGGTIKAIFTNGTTATRLYRRYQYPLTGIPAIPLPTTTPANAKKSLDSLVESWSVIKDCL